MVYVKKPYNSGQWTEARMNQFIKSALRTASMKWPPRNVCAKKAWVSRGVYLCAGYKTKAHEVKRTSSGSNNIYVDHIEPVIPPSGFTTWDDAIRRMFPEEEGFQLLCKDCHSEKTKDERNERTKLRRLAKESS
jgi:hypothetical protein